MDLPGSLGTLWGNVKNVTLPGLFAALAFALVIWPPKPYDRIPTVIDNHPDIAKLRLVADQLKDDTQASFGEYLKFSAPACMVREGADSYKFLTIPTVREMRAVAVKNQLILDDLDRTLLKCVEEEQALQGVEDQAIKNMNALIATRTTERDGINTIYQKYILSLSPMQGDFKEKLRSKEEEIAQLQAHALNFQRIQNERTRRVSELQRLEREIQQRLADAGRLRPTQKFDDVLSALSNHVVALITLVLAWGLLIDPVNRGIFGFVYDSGFDDPWDNVRRSRNSPGQDAYDKWYGKREHRVRSWFSRGRAIIFILIALLIVGLVIFLWAPRSFVPPRADTIVCASADSITAGQSLTLSATVTVPSPLAAPDGTVQFLDGDNVLGSPSTLDKGTASYKANNLSAQDHIITARYEAARTEGRPILQASTSMPVVVSVVSVPQTAQALYSTCSAPRPGLLPPFWGLFLKCLVVALLGVGIAWLWPSLFAPEPAEGVAERPTDAERAAFNNSSDVDVEAPLTDDQEMARALVQKLADELKQELEKDLERLSGEQKWAYESVQQLAKDLLQRLRAMSTSEQERAEGQVRTLADSLKRQFNSGQELTDESVQQLAKNLVDELGITKSASEERLAEDLVRRLAEGLKTSVDQKKLDELVQYLTTNFVAQLRVMSASEQKLAEDLVQKLADDLKKQSSGEPAPGDQKKKQPKSEQELVNNLIEQLAKDLVKNLSQGPRKPLTCEQKLAKLWKKISQPQYAIGQNLLSRSDFEALQNSYYSQSLVSIGLVIPLFFLVLALLLTPQFGLNGRWVYVVLGIGEVLLVVTGVDRRHKYQMELEGQIAGAFLKICVQNEKSAADKSDKSLASQITDALKAATIVKKTGLTIVPEDASATKTQASRPATAQTAASGKATAGQTAPATGKVDAAQAPTVASQISDALKAATIIEKTALTIVPGEPPAPAPAAPAAPATPSQAPGPAKPDATQKPAPPGKTDNPPDTDSK
jgi:hypothetical protein